MAIEVRWADEQKQYIYWHYETEFSVEDNVQALHQYKALLEEAGRQVPVLINGLNLVKLPDDFLTELQKVVTHAENKFDPAETITVFVTRDPYWYAALETFKETKDPRSQSAQMVKTVEEAVKIIQDHLNGKPSGWQNDASEERDDASEERDDASEERDDASAERDDASAERDDAQEP